MQRDYIEFENTAAEFKMIFVEGGVFEMGVESDSDDSEPIHTVQLNKYWIGEFPVTQAVWAYVMSDTDIANPSYFKDINRSVEQISWEDIDMYFLPKLNEKTKNSRPAGIGYRLPTEAEWEYAARGGKYWWQYPFEYAGSNKLEEVGWHNENSHQETKRVGLKTPNLLGLYDMSGNVWEWCSDWYGPYPSSGKNIIVNPIGPATGLSRVFRGGSWIINALHCRSTNRRRNTPEGRYHNLSFRLVLSFSLVQ